MHIFLKFKKSAFVKDSFIVLLGLVFSQITTISSVIILARLYSPDDFGRLSIFVAISNIILVISSFQYLNSIVLEKDKNNSIIIVYMCFILSFLVSACIAFFLSVYIIFFGSTIDSLLLFFFPLMAFTLSIKEGVFLWLNKIKKYALLSFFRVFHSLLLASVSIYFGIYHRDTFDLIYSLTIVNIIFSIFLFSYFIYHNKFTLNISSARNMCFKYINFPKYTLLAEFIRLLSVYMPNIFLAKVSSVYSLGYYDMSNRFIGGPSGIVGQAISMVFREKASVIISSGKSCQGAYVRLMIVMIIASLPPLFVVFLFSEDIFVVLLGEEWKQAGDYAKILIPLFFFRFVAAPLSVLFHITGKQREDFLISLYTLLSMFVLFSLSFIYDSEIKKTILLYSLNYSTVYIYVICRGYYFSFNRVVYL